MTQRRWEKRRGQRASVLSRRVKNLRDAEEALGRTGMAENGQDESRTRIKEKAGRLRPCMQREAGCAVRCRCRSHCTAPEPQSRLKPPGPGRRLQAGLAGRWPLHSAASAARAGAQERVRVPTSWVVCAGPANFISLHMQVRRCAGALVRWCAGAICMRLGCSPRVKFCLAGRHPSQLLLPQESYSRMGRRDYA